MTEDDELFDALARACPGCRVDVQQAAVRITTPAGRAVELGVDRRGSVTPAVADQLAGRSDRDSLLVVADLVHSSAGDVLRRAGISHWDRRGRIFLHSSEPYMHVDTETHSHVRGADGPRSTRAITGRAGLAVAVALCMWPGDGEREGVRRIADAVAMSPSAVSEARARLVRHGLVEPDGSPLLPELFWAVSDVWNPVWLATSTWPDSIEWRMAGHGAAAFWGARTMTGTPQAYAPDEATLRRHLALHAADPREEVRYLVAAPPTPLVATGDLGFRHPNPSYVHPVIAALDLSLDVRGREVLSTWQEIDTTGLPDSPFPGPAPRRVWS